MAPTAEARKHVEEIRRTKFSIGGEPNPLTEDLHQAVKNLSAELYAKDVHFLMEIIQDNEYEEGVDPSLEFVITSKDITGTGAPSTLLVFNNEKGFSPKNIESICSVGRSTKKGLRKRGYIGEKGIGFKSVFLITTQPYIFSNGYQIRFNEKPCQQCNVGYIVPEWVEGESTLSAIQSVYGSTSALPTTTLVLPLKPEKVKPVKDQLSSIHPEVLLFLSKIKRLSVREDNWDPRHNTVSAISISTEKNFVTKKNIDAESYTLHLTADDVGDDVDRQCGYYMWKQRFPVKNESRVDVRTEVEEWVITLAFPNGKRLNRGVSLPGIYSFLPTETVTNFPFIIQADFLLASSRENILWDNKWNQGILDCVPNAFLNAFVSLVKSTEEAPVSSLPRMFWFLPVDESSHPELNHVRDAIKAKLMLETIVPCESYTGQKLFCKPCEVGRLKPAFWSILNRARSQGVSFNNISSHGQYLLASTFDTEEYNAILNFLEIKPINAEWYAKCIGSCNLVMGVSEDVYLELLVFLLGSWDTSFQNTNIKNIPIIKYVGLDGNVCLFRINQVSHACGTTRLLAASSNHIDWLINWNKEFRCLTGQFFLPKPTQKAIESSPKKQTLEKWLRDEVNVKLVTVAEYAELLRDSLKHDGTLVVSYAHFLHLSLKADHLLEHEVQNLCSKMPLVDNYGQVTVSRSGVLVPANGSRWVELIGVNPWRQHNYVELGEDYMRSVRYAGGMLTAGEELVQFLKTYVGASDVPYLSPPDAAIPTLSAPLTERNTFLLLEWLCNLRAARTRLPERFLSSVRDGSWLKISLSGFPGHRPPSESFMLHASSGHLLQNGSVLVDIPLIDHTFYGNTLSKYRKELRMIGVRFEDKEACEFIGQRLMSLAVSSTLTRDNVLSILNFIKFLSDSYLSPENFINSIKGGRWIRTSKGDMDPTNSVLFSQEWDAASQISDIPFIDQDYYGKELLSFKRELELLGVTVAFNQSYQLVYNNLKSSSYLVSLSSDAILLILSCIKFLSSSDKLVQALRDKKCLKTNLGYRCPSECFLLNTYSKWGCLLQVFCSFPVLDENFYEECIFSFRNELKKIGVMVNIKDASKEFARTFKQQASLRSIRKENVLSLMSCYRKLKATKFKLPSELKDCIRQEKWLHTRLGDYRSPNECILFGTEWEPISSISLLPFVDDSNNFYGMDIHDYRKELKQLGVVTEFKDGAKFVAAGLFLPPDSSRLKPVNVYALLDSVRELKEREKSIPDGLLKKVAHNWLKTRFGYRRPDQCLLFYSDWEPFLKREDGPFIDDDFYGPDIRLYKEELRALGVSVDVNKGCQLLAGSLTLHSDFQTIGRIYSYLSEFNWEPIDEDSRRIWIPRGTDKGEWVMPEDCVLHDKSNLFGERLNVLEKFKYEKKVVNFFANVFDVKVHPSVDDYCKLWKVWESSGDGISPADCCAFWEFAVRNWNAKTEDTFKGSLLKLPVSAPTSDAVSLIDKRDVFIGDDLFLMDLFERSSKHPLFVWYPQPSLKSLTRPKLLDIYTKLGVQTLSESVQKHVSDVDDVGFKRVDPRDIYFKRGLFRLILGFLADLNLKIEAERRRKAVSRMLTVTTLETVEPMTVQYSLSLSSGDVVKVGASRMIRWDKHNSKFFMQNLDKSKGHKNILEYASHFAQVIAEGVLWENEDLVPQLSELIRLGFLVDFDEEAVDFLMKTKNLHMYQEDQDFLCSTFST